MEGDEDEEGDVGSDVERQPVIRGEDQKTGSCHQSDRREEESLGPGGEALVPLGQARIPGRETDPAPPHESYHDDQENGDPEDDVDRSEVETGHIRPGQLGGSRVRALQMIRAGVIGSVRADNDFEVAVVAVVSLGRGIVIATTASTSALPALPIVTATTSPTTSAAVVVILEQVADRELRHEQHHGQPVEDAGANAIARWAGDRRVGGHRPILPGRHGGYARAMSRIFKTAVADVYPHYVTKVEKKGRSIDELHQVIAWLTGYDEKTLTKHLTDRTTFEDFFAAADLNPNVTLITGSVCGVKIQEVEDPLMRQIRYLDKLVDELAKGRPMEKVLRSGT